ncbi:ATP-binding protein [Hyalangium gracile]|uniref:ATP-binding protein n=1 Tax=Hyalangium gracile TaxID=394092 RepID=UPI001CCF084E|nr:ATP-binding protein [Hyalangium gracile]
MSWEQHNRAFLSACLQRVRLLLERHADSPEGASPPAKEDAEGWPEWSEEAERPPALRTLCEAFRLSPFERDVLLLCAGLELDARFPALFARAQGDAQRPYPTFSLALAALPGSHWDALAPQAPLRRWGLVGVGAGAALALAPLKADERIWQFLLGIDGLDERLARLLHAPPEAGPLVPSHEELARQVAATCISASRDARLPVLQLCGRSRHDQAAIAARASELLDLELHVLPAENLPSEPEELERLARLWSREALLDRRALLLDCHDLETGEGTRSLTIPRLAGSIQGLLFLASPERRPTGARLSVLQDVPLPRPDEQRALWADALGRRLDAKTARALEPQAAIDALVNQFDLDQAAITSATTQGLGHLMLRQKPKPEQLAEALWTSALGQSRHRLEALAQRLEVRADWEDLMLPDSLRQQLREVELHLRHRGLVHHTWGFSPAGWRGTGTSVLFSGPSGTGKTLAAEVLAKRLRLELYRIDLSGVVSKYIGETEKNLRRVFDAAESGGAVLLFDEADALFGKRSEVKDSHDRYANLEVSYLLQRMESFHGLAILTTNRRSALDQAFLRRLRFIVDFPMPGPRQRRALWQRAFPPGTPTEGLDPSRLALLEVSGAVIRGIALHAAFLAAQEAREGNKKPAVRPRHVLAAARRELEKLQLPFPNLPELEGWE